MGFLKSVKTKLAIDLVTFRYMWEANPEATLKFCRELTFDGIEIHYGMREVPVEDMQSYLEKYHLRMISYFADLETLKTDADRIIAYCQGVGAQNLVLESLDLETADRLNEVIDDVKKIAEKAADAGIQLSYQNRKDTKPLLKRILEEVPDLKIAYDTFWFAAADQEPAAYFAEYNDYSGNLIRFGDGARLNELAASDVLLLPNLVRDGYRGQDFIPCAAGHGTVPLRQAMAEAKSRQILWGVWSQDCYLQSERTDAEASMDELIRFRRGNSPYWAEKDEFEQKKLTKGPRALVTGADRGLGFSFTKLLLETGWTVFAGQFMPQWPDLGKLQEQYPDKLYLVPLDVSNDLSVDRAKEFVESATDGLELVINDAAIMPSTMAKSATPIRDWTNDADIFHRPDMSMFARCYDINSLGPLRVSNRFIPLLIKGKGERTLVNISSEGGSMEGQWCERDFQLCYCMTKAALNMQSVIIQQSLRPYNVKVILANPGGMKTFLVHGEVSENNSKLVSPDDTAKSVMKLVAEHRDVDEPMYWRTSGSAMPW